MRQLTLFAVAVLLSVSPLVAQPLADKVPANPIFYFGWRGADDLGPAYADSHLKAILDQSNIRAIFNDMVPRAVMRVSRDNPQAGVALRIANDIAGTMWHHPCAVYIADVEIRGKNDYALKAAVLCQAGNDSAHLLSQLQALLQQAGKTPVPLRAIQSGDIVAFTIGYSDTEDAVALAAAKPLGSEAQFTAAMANVQKDPVLAIYVNTEHVWSLIDGIVEQEGDAKAKEYWPRVRDASGLAGLKRIVATSAFDGKDWMQSAFIEAPPPRTGLLAMLDSQPLNEQMLKLAPMDSDCVLAGTFNIARLVGLIRDGIAQVDPDAGQIADKAIGAVSLYVGKDFQKEVLEPLGEHWLYYSSPTIAGRGIFGGVIINQPTDPSKASQGLMATQIAIFNTAAPFVARHNMTLRAQNMKAGDLSINYVAVPVVSPAWCVSGGNLYVSLFPQNIISAAHFTASGGKSIVDNPNFIDLRKRLNAPDRISSICYVDLTQTVGEGYQGVLVFSRLALGIGDLFGVKSPEPVIPPLDVFVKNIGPSGRVSWIDDSGWHCRCVSSFPGAEIFAGGNCAALGVVGELFPVLGAMGAKPGHMH